MNWRKSISLSFLPLMAFLGFLLMDKKQDERPASARTVASLVQSKSYPKARKVLSPQSATALKGRSDQNAFLRNRIPQSIETQLEKDPEIVVTKGYEFLKDVGAVSKQNYTPDMGDIIHERGGMVFFRSSSGHTHVPVAISKMTKSLYPISSVLHIKGATPLLRQEVLAQGHKEYYYHAPLKFLSIKSESGQVLRVYSELKEKGFKVELEVLKPQHQTI